MNKANTYFNQHFYPVKNKTGRKESKSYEVRQRWKELGFPTYAAVDEDMGLPKNTTNKFASKYGYKKIKDTYYELLQQEKAESEEKQIEEMEEDYTQIWSKLRADKKYELQKVTDEIQELQLQLPNSNNADKIRNKIEKLWQRHDEIIDSIGKIMIKERINKKLPNTYKDTSADNLKIEQSGELKLTQKVEFENEEEKLERYAAYFEQLNPKTDDTVSK